MSSLNKIISIKLAWQSESLAGLSDRGSNLPCLTTWVQWVGVLPLSTAHYADLLSLLKNKLVTPTVSFPFILIVCFLSFLYFLLFIFFAFFLSLFPFILNFWHFAFFLACISFYSHFLFSLFSNFLFSSALFLYLCQLCTSLFCIFTHLYIYYHYYDY